MSSDLHLCKATDDDLPALLGLYKHLVAEDPDLPIPKAREIFQTFEKAGMGSIFLGKRGETAICSCVLVIVPNLTRGGAPFGLIENVVTHSEHRGKGYGQAVINHAVSDAFSQSCYKVMLLTGSSKPGTLAFYKQCGFEQTKTGFEIRRIAKRAE